jgi:hypothetical protein
MISRFLPAVLTAFALSTAAVAQNQGPFCDEGGVWTTTCQGATSSITVTLNAYDPDGDPLTYQWAACPGSFLTDPTSAVTDVVLDTSNTCDVFCGVRLRVTDPSGEHYTCRLYVQVVPGDEGCSQGYWKNKLSQWSDTGYSPNDDFDATFGVNAFSPNIKLKTAIDLNGGGLKKLARHAVAALLNAGDPDVAYALAPNEVITLVRDAITTCQYEPLASQLEQYNDGEGGCPNGGGGCGGNGGGGWGGGNGCGGGWGGGGWGNGCGGGNGGWGGWGGNHHGNGFCGSFGSMWNWLNCNYHWWN